MARHALSWVADGTPAAIGLDPREQLVIGRDPRSQVMIDRPTVSRRQAVLRHDGTSVDIENLSATNPTRVDGDDIAGPMRLHDGATISAGGESFRFHDLAAGDRVGGPMCSHCGRENNRNEVDCWFCGTALVNAPTTMRVRVKLLGRVVGADGEVVGFSVGQALVLAGEGWAVIDGDPAPDVPALVRIDSGIVLRSGTASGAVVTHADGKDRSAEPLRTGDLIRAADRGWVIVVR